MLSRRHLRIKVFQALYAFFQSGDDNLEAAERQLFRSFDKLYELYIWQLSILLEINDFAEKMMESARKKYFPTEDELNPSLRFIENQFIGQLRGNKAFITQVNRFKVSWSGQEDLIRKIWYEFRAGEEYQRYMSGKTGSYAEDKDIVKTLLRRYVMPSDLLQSFYEEKSIYWIGDFETACMMALKTIKNFREDMGIAASLPEMIKDDEGEDEFKDFISPLFQKTVLHNQYFSELISANAEHWDIERIASIDVIILKMALCEMLQFSSIPLKVTINEYIEIAKEYSTPKSRIFVNGMLDKLMVKLMADQKIIKRGRGLME